MTLTQSAPPARLAVPPFQVLLDRHRDDVYRFLTAIVGRDLADDCFQETFLSALRAYDRIDDASNLRSWLLTIAHRKAIDAVRARARRPLVVADVPEGHARDQDEPADEALWTLVRELPPRQRAAVAHRFVNDLAYREIGRVMGCSPEAARRSVHEGLTRLRKDWSP